MFKTLLASATLSLALIAGAHAADKPAKESMQTKYDLYVTAKEAHAMMTGGGERVVLVDVRDPAEVMFTGFTEMAEVHVPWVVADVTGWHPKLPHYNFTRNPNFLAELEAGLARIGAGKDTTLVIMCRSGSTRSAPAADMLHERGYKAVYSMVDGFEGAPLKEGPSKGVRASEGNGWRNSGLPWTSKLSKEKVWLKPAS